HPEEALLDQVVQRGGLELDREHARLDLRDVEDVLHEADQALHRFLAERDQLALVGRVLELGAGDQDVEGALHDREGRAFPTAAETCRAKRVASGTPSGWNCARPPSATSTPSV